MASVDGFVSRVTHTLTGAFLFAYAVAPYMWAESHSLKLSPGWLAPVAAALSVLSGLYNASKAKPKDFKQPSVYRWAVYSKIPFILAFTPTLVGFLGEDNGRLVRLAVAILMFLMGARARFIREGETLKAANAK